MSEFPQCACVVKDEKIAQACDIHSEWLRDNILKATQHISNANLGTRLNQLLSATRHAMNTDGEIWECGVFRGRSARWIAFQVSEYLDASRSNTDARHKTVRLFDSFAGRSEKMPEDEGPNNSRFADTSLELVKSIIPWDFVKYYKGFIPTTFDGLEDREIAFLHLDVDLYQPTYDTLQFVMPRLTRYGVILIDDYEHPDWPGVTVAAKKAVEEMSGFTLVLTDPHIGVIRHKQ